MKRQWRVRRQTCARPDGLCRWDRAYQSVLAWTVTGSSALDGRPNGEGRPATACPVTEQERTHADWRVCTRLDDAPGRGSEH
jgi:hypothetical protein